MQEAIHAASHSAQKREKGDGAEGGGGGHGHDATPGVEIPTPGCYIVKTYEAETPVWKRPDNYVLYAGATPDELDEAVEYDADDADEALARRLGVPIERFELLIDRLEKVAGYADGDIPSLDVAAAALAADPQLRGVAAAVVSAAYAHWVAKRAGNEGAPFVERFRKPPAPDDPSPYRAFRVRERERAHKKKALGRNDQAAYERMLLLRQDLDRLRALLDLVRRREHTKRTHMALLRQLADARIADTARRAARRRGGAGAEWGSGSESASEEAEEDEDEDEEGEASWSARAARDTRHDGEWEAEAGAGAREAEADDEDEDDEHDALDGLEERVRRALLGHTPSGPRAARARDRGDADAAPDWDALLPDDALAASAAAQDRRRDEREAAALRGEALRLPDGQSVRGRVRWGRGGRLVLERTLSVAPAACMRPAAAFVGTVAAPDPADDVLYDPPPLAHLSPYEPLYARPRSPPAVPHTAVSPSSLLPPPSSSSASSAPIPAAAASSSSLHAPTPSAASAKPLVSPLAPVPPPSAPPPFLPSDSPVAARGRWRAPPLFYPRGSAQRR